MRANCTAFFLFPNTSARRTKIPHRRWTSKKASRQRKSPEFSYHALCANQMKEARGRRGVCVWVLLCMNGASSLCVHSSSIVSIRKLSTPREYEDDLSYSSDSLQTSPYRKVVAEASQKVTVSSRWVCDTEYTEWQLPLSGVHSIMMEKLAQAGEDGRGSAQ